MSSLRDAALLLFAALDELGIQYAVGGSFASSFHGIARATQDLDLVVALPTHLAPSRILRKMLVSSSQADGVNRD